MVDMRVAIGEYPREQSSTESAVRALLCSSSLLEAVALCN